MFNVVGASPDDCRALDYKLDWHSNRLQKELWAQWTNLHLALGIPPRASKGPCDTARTQYVHPCRDNLRSSSADLLLLEKQSQAALVWMKTTLKAHWKSGRIRSLESRTHTVGHDWSAGTHGGNSRMWMWELDGQVWKKLQDKTIANCIDRSKKLLGGGHRH